MEEKKEIPVFLINGFLDSGKTSFLSYTIGADYFHIDGNTLLILCENGEKGYDEKLLEKENTTLVRVKKHDTLTAEYLTQLRDMADAMRVLIEYNGMWPDPSGIEMPEGWEIFQQVTIIDGTTLGMYLANMRPLLGPMLRGSELCIVNRCDSIARKELQEYRKILRPMLLNGSSIVMQDRYGEIHLPILDEDLPYDVSRNEVIVKSEDYGIWFFDVRDYPDRYDNKIIEFAAQIRRSDKFIGDVFVLGRLTMICCENDITFLGYLASTEGAAEDFPDDSWVTVRAAVDIRDRKEYGGEGPFLLIRSMTLSDPIKEPARFS